MKPLSKEDENRATDLHKRSIFINALDPICYPELLSQEYLLNQKQGGVNAINMTVPWVDDDFDTAIAKIGYFYDVCDKLSSDVTITTTEEEIRKAKRDGGIAAIMGFQNSKPVGDNLHFLKVFHKLGVRIIVLAYQSRSYIGDGCAEKTDCGLSNFGIKAIETMNRLGILVDLSHVGRKTSLEAIEISKKPVIFSHSNANSLCVHVRNLVDEEIKTLAEKGGVVGITCSGGGQSVKKGSPTVEDFLDHIDYVTKLVGINHVGIGMDRGTVGRTRERYETLQRSHPELRRGYTFEDYMKPPVAGLDRPVDWMNITRGLVQRGYSDQDVQKVLGENFLRVFRTVWREN
jgi:membrane dipeptidase